jgi:tRNA(Ile)-lysidine synthase
MSISLITWGRSRFYNDVLSSLPQRVAATIDRHAMFACVERAGVAVSGGADSVCLLHVLRHLAPRWNLCLTVIHLDHGLRGEESRADAEWVASLAAQLGLACVVRRADVAAAGGNFEQAARDARLALFRELIGSGQVERVALGHTRSDQAETVLFRFLRGAGTAGLAGICPVTSDGIVRPLIEVERAEVEEYLRENGLAWREDSTNSSPRFARNRIRHDLLPQLARDWNPAIRDTLAHTAEWALAEEAWWEREIDRLETSLLEVSTGGVMLHAAALRELPVAAARRLVRRAIERAKGDLRGVDFAHVESILRLASQPTGSGGVDIHGVVIRRSFDCIRLALPGKQPHAAGYRLEAPVPGCVRIPGTGSLISLEVVEKPETSALSDYVYNREMSCLDWGRVSGSLVVRNWMPGDRFKRSDDTGPQKLKALFHLARIPVWDRANWPVLEDGKSVLWTRHFGAAADVAADEGTRVILRVRETVTV